MKKILFLTISILMVSTAFSKVKGANPIPSYNVSLTDKAYFQENTATTLNYDPSKEKRDLNVSNDGAGSKSNGTNELSSMTVYIYRLDQSIVLGPFIVPVGEVVTVPIDGNRWGVFTQTDQPTNASVWTN
jgi:hypothetical protein